MGALFSVVRPGKLTYPDLTARHSTFVTGVHGSGFRPLAGTLAAWG